MGRLLTSPVESDELDGFERRDEKEEMDRMAMLSEEQRAALNVALDGVSFFFTGSAGTAPFAGIMVHSTHAY